ncbi:hypothetical protein HDU99_000508 [Rhizoclosmatium hyalinum]|nr:hypothetical protein HDU99_000508 [Rhizoclosmatium hyalinum]
MLSQSDAEDFALLTDDKLSEKLFDVKMTRIFQNALGPDVHFVNSEECGWLMQGGDSSTDFKPDFHVTVKGLYMHKEEPDDAVQEARRLVHETYGTVFRFGTPPKELWGMITILERKLKFTEGRDFGQTRCWLIRAREKNVLYSIENVDWLAGGSKEKFVNFVQSSLQPWKGLILDACNHFNVDLVNENAFLGTGATGRVFKVCRTTNGKTNYYALKIVLKPNNLSLISECRMLKAAEKTGVVVSVVGEFKQFGNGTGGGLLISPVGVPVNRAKLTQSLLHRVAKVLFALHLEGLQHGDPRLPNLIQFKRQLYWIDLMASILDGEYRWREDASAVSRSVLGLHQDDNLPENITALIDQYALNKNEAACLALADGWWSELEFQS